MAIAFTFTQSSSGGGFGPGGGGPGGGPARNPYIAVWIEDGAEQMVQTVALWIEQGKGQRQLNVEQQGFGLKAPPLRACQPRAEPAPGPAPGQGRRRRDRPGATG